MPPLSDNNGSAATRPIDCVRIAEAVVAAHAHNDQAPRRVLRRLNVKHAFMTSSCSHQCGPRSHGPAVMLLDVCVTIGLRTRLSTRFPNSSETRTQLRGIVLSVKRCGRLGMSLLGHQPPFSRCGSMSALTES